MYSIFVKNLNGVPKCIILPAYTVALKAGLFFQVCNDGHIICLFSWQKVAREGQGSWTENGEEKANSISS